MAFWLIFEEDGRFHQIISDEKPEVDAIKVSRHTLDPHCEHYDRKTKKWVHDHEKRKAVDQRHRIIDMTSVERYEELKAEITGLNQRIEYLEKLIRKDENSSTP